MILKSLLSLLAFLFILLVSGKLLLDSETHVNSVVFGMLGILGLSGSLVFVYFLWSDYLWLASNLGVIIIGFCGSLIHLRGIKITYVMVGLQIIWVIAVLLKKKIISLKTQDANITSQSYTAFLKYWYLIKTCRHISGVSFFLASVTASFILTYYSIEDAYTKLNLSVFNLSVILFSIGALFLSIDFLLALPFLHFIKDQEKTPIERVMQLFFIGMIPFAAFMGLASYVFSFLKINQAIAVGFMIWLALCCIWGTFGYNLIIKKKCIISRKI